MSVTRHSLTTTPLSEIIYLVLTTDEGVEETRVVDVSTFLQVKSSIGGGPRRMLMYTAVDAQVIRLIDTQIAALCAVALALGYAQSLVAISLNLEGEEGMPIPKFVYNNATGKPVGTSAAAA